MTSNFHRLDRAPLLPSRIAALLMERIVAGELKPGGRLPTENALAAEFGVSRNVVREAIARMQSEGIVETRHGIGAFVSEVGVAESFRIRPEQLDDRDSMARLFELRAMIEIETATLAAQRADEAALDKIERPLLRMQGLEMWSDEGIQADLDFHIAIAAATRNEHIQTLVHYIAGHMRGSIAETRARSTSMAETIKVTVDEHVAIFTALQAGDPAAARLAMTLHVRNGAGRLGLGSIAEEAT